MSGPLFLIFHPFLTDLKIKKLLFLLIDSLIFLPSLASEFELILSELECLLELPDPLAPLDALLLLCDTHGLDLLRVLPLQGVQGSLGVRQLPRQFRHFL